uniref:Dentin sialophosphoprotein-like n=1 Tax=Diabrotica virgifera virgifera TaxID=50390 RepID=A0A6P7FQ77_DIAVI
MEGLDYYKSLITDDEVISALIKDSKVREGEIEKPRVRPNLNFFQRTVSNLVSSNNRISDNQEKLIAKEKEKNKRCRPRKIPVRKKLAIDYIKEILSDRIEFVKAKDQESADTEKSTNDLNLTDDDKLRIGTPSNHDIKQKQKRVFVCKKTPFQQIREILSNNVDKSNSASSSNELKDSTVLKNVAEHEIEDALSSRKTTVSEIKRKFSGLSTNTSKIKRLKHENTKCRSSSYSSDESSNDQRSSSKKESSTVLSRKTKTRRSSESSDDSSCYHRSSFKKTSTSFSTRKLKIRQSSDSSDNNSRPSLNKNSFTSSKKNKHFRQRRESSEVSVISVSDSSYSEDSDSDVCIVEEK